MFCSLEARAGAMFQPRMSWKVVPSKPTSCSTVITKISSLIGANVVSQYIFCYSASLLMQRFDNSWLVVLLFHSTA
jgi:hypothetical protein